MKSYTKFKKSLMESSLKQVMYHGTPYKFEVFDSQKLGGGHDQYGPGFYFTSNKQTAMRYAENGYILEAKLDFKNPIPGDKPIDRNIAEKLLLRAHDVNSRKELLNKFEQDEEAWWESPLSDWDESPETAFNKLLQSVLDQENAQESMQTIWYDGFRADNSKYMAEAYAMGIDGVILNNVFQDSNEVFAICFSPEQIQIINSEKV